MYNIPMPSHANYNVGDRSGLSLSLSICIHTHTRVSTYNKVSLQKGILLYCIPFCLGAQDSVVVRL